VSLTFSLNTEQVMVLVKVVERLVWKNLYGVLAPVKCVASKKLEEENRRLKQMAADLPLDKHPA
jgi:hypothetical protein